MPYDEFADDGDSGDESHGGGIAAIPGGLPPPPPPFPASATPATPAPLSEDDREFAELARQQVPEEVAAAYGTSHSFGPDYIIPAPFDPRLMEEVPAAVAKAAMESGVARQDIADLDAYRHTLKSRLNPTNSVLTLAYEQARAQPLECRAEPPTAHARPRSHAPRRAGLPPDGPRDLRGSSWHTGRGRAMDGIRGARSRGRLGWLVAQRDDRPHPPPSWHSLRDLRDCTRGACSCGAPLFAPQFALAPARVRVEFLDREVALVHEGEALLP